MNEPKPLYRCDLCKSVDYEDPVIGCKKCGFDEMRPIDSKGASKPPPTPGPSDERLTNEDMSRLRNDLPNFCESEFVARSLAALASTPPALITGATGRGSLVSRTRLPSASHRPCAI